MAEYENQKLNRLKLLEDKLAKEYKASPSAYSESKLRDTQKRVESVESQELKDRWYGQYDNAEQRQNDSGLMEKALNALASPLYGVVGVAELATGENTEKGLKNIISNIKERQTFADLLRKKDVPGASVLGFGLDVALDPVNWATVGTGALIPKVAKGFRKAGLEGAGAALKSKALGAGKFVPYLSKKIGDDAVRAEETYRRLIGKSWQDYVSEVKDTKRVGEVIDDYANDKPRLKSFIDKIAFRQRDWFDKKVADDLAKQGKNAYNVPEVSSDVFESGFENLYKKNNLVGKTQEEIDALIDMNRASKLGKNPKIAPNFKDEAERALLDEALNNATTRDALEKKVKERFSDTGIKFYDDISNAVSKFKVKDVEVGKKIAEAYQNFISLFKISKVAFTPTGYTNAILGNPTMAGMHGIPIYDKAFYKNIGKASALMFGKDSKLVSDVLKNEKWAEFINKHGMSDGLFGDTFGFLPSFFKKRRAVSDMLEEASRANILSRADLKKITSDPKELKKMRSLLNKEANAYKNIVDKSDVVPSTYREYVEDAVMNMEDSASLNRTLGKNIAEGVEASSGKTKRTPVSFLVSDLYDEGFDSWRKRIRESSKKDGAVGKFYKALDWYTTKPLDTYGKIDQSYRLGTAVYLTEDGLDLTSLRKLGRFTKIGVDDVTRVVKDGKEKFLLNPDKAVEAVLDIYMNYSAMPAAVKMFRNLPFMGNAFASFVYGMSTKTGRTAMYNPSLFNKINFVLNDFQGEKGAIEKEALKDEYNQYYNNIGMFKIPFMKDYPVYINLANMIPYYTLNMFDNSERKYEKTLTKPIAEIVDKIGMFKQPEGQVLFDYIIQPYILQETNPTGAFGQPIYPKDATLGEKAFLASRQMAESVVPGVAAVIPVPESFVKYLPSYRWRDLNMAGRGKTEIGALTKEPRVTRTARKLGATAGFSTHVLNLDYVNTNKDKK